VTISTKNKTLVRKIIRNVQRLYTGVMYNRDHSCQQFLSVSLLPVRIDL